MTNGNQPPDIFCDRRKQALLSRAAAREAQCFIWDYLAEEISDRLLVINRSFADVLIIGPLARDGQRLLSNHTANITAAMTNADAALKAGCVYISDEKLPFAPQSFDLVICTGVLDTVNDLPGFLIQIRRCLRPDGLFLGSLFGEGNFASLKSTLIAAEQDRMCAHIHPQIDLRSAADLLSRAGFALPVADKDILRVRYSSLNALLCDIRDMGAGNALSGKRSYFGQAAYRRLFGIWDSLREHDNKVEEQFSFLHLIGWAPADTQPKPAQRGSAKVSLTQVLKSR
jgi:NADH dehydrogenase [ubiquinone] 1 alpha subcomplex assembly factor 5